MFGILFCIDCFVIYYYNSNVKISDISYQHTNNTHIGVDHGKETT